MPYADARRENARLPQARLEQLATMQSTPRQEHGQKREISGLTAQRGARQWAGRLIYEHHKLQAADIFFVRLDCHSCRCCLALVGEVAGANLLRARYLECSCGF